MSLLILEGVDRVGKTSVAEHFKNKGYELIHQSAPSKGMTADLFLEEMMQVVSSASHKDIVLDRSYYGEYGVWPQVYGRESLLTDENLEVLKELEQSVGVTKILMYDPNVEAHWKRCTDNNEPMTRPQFVRARALFSSLADKHGFVRKTLQDFPEIAIVPQEPKKTEGALQASTNATPKLTKEQMKLETANAINDVLSKRIIKSKGPMYDQIESSLRTYLNTELGKILGTKTETSGQFDNEEVDLLKFFCKKLKEKK